MDEIIWQENNKLSAEYEAHENVDYEIDENDLYHIDNTSLDENKEKIEWRKRAFEKKLENIYEIEIYNGMTCIHRNKVNKWSECNLLHDIINPPKRIKNLNRNYYPILQG